MKLLRQLCGTVLIMEAIVIVLAIPVAIVLEHVHHGVAVSVGRGDAFVVYGPHRNGFAIDPDELALLAEVTAPYAHDPVTANLVSFAPRDSGRRASQSWRDSARWRARTDRNATRHAPLVRNRRDRRPQILD